MAGGEWKYRFTDGLGEFTFSRRAPPLAQVLDFVVGLSDHGSTELVELHIVACFGCCEKFFLDHEVQF